MKMKNVNFALMAAVVCCAVASCAKEITLLQQEVDSFDAEDGISWQFFADVESSLTRMSDMDERGEFSWENGDRIKILYEGGSTTATAIVSASGTSFSPVVPEGVTTLWMVYPSDMDASLDEGILTVGMPAVQKDALSGYFVAKASLGDESVTFRHPLCYYKFVVGGDGSDVTRLHLSSAAGNALAASSLALSFDAQGAPSVSSVSASASELTVDFSGDGIYYVPVVPAVSPVAGDLTFQFYRSASRSEKAGAYTHGSALSNAFASLINWADLPTKATNRYVSTTGSASNNGVSPSTPWNFGHFQSFLENTNQNGNTTRDAATLSLFDGVNIRFAAGTYNVSSKVTPDISIRLNLIGEDKSNTSISGQNSVLLFDLYKQTMSLSFKNLTLKNASNANNGGALRVGKGSLSFEDCAFSGNQVTKSECGGGVLNAWGTTSLTFTRCSFSGNVGSYYGGVLYFAGSASAEMTDCTFAANHAGSGGVFYMADNSVLNCTGCSFNDNYATPAGGVCCTVSPVFQSFTDCRFEGNQAQGNWGACIYLFAADTRVKLNRCLFKNNSAASRGVVAANATGGLVYMNDVSFKGNSVTAADGYGTVTHGNGGSVFCMNNVTSADNRCTNASPSNNNWTHTVDGSFLIVNSSFVDKGRQHVVRQNMNDASVDVSICNNIVVQVDGYQDYPIWVRNVGTLVNNGHNLRSGTSTGNLSASSDKLSVTATALGGSWSEVWDATARYGVYEWNGSVADFTPATQTEVENTIKGFDHSVTGIAHIGNDFYSWLNEIGALGKEGRGVVRSDPWWPGAYQN